MPLNSPDVSKPSVLRPFLSKFGFSFKKGLGQNFLIDGHVLDKIVDASEVSELDGVLEVGPGAGVVTQRMARAAKRVVAIEKDESLRPVLAESLADFSNVDVLFSDVLDLGLSQVWSHFADCRHVSVVANLPYYVTTPILFHLLESQVPIRNIVVMVQREVADRMQAAPGGKDYGALTVSVQYRTEVSTVTQVKPTAFMPPPGVESTVVRLQCRPQPAVVVANEAYFFRVVRAAFGMRRKTLLNALSAQLSIGKETCETCLKRVGIDPQRRGETLSIQEFAALSDVLLEHA